MAFHHCYGLNCIFQNSYVEALALNMVVFGEGAFARVLQGHNRSPQSNGIRVLIRGEGDMRVLSHSLSLHTEKTPCEDTQRR